jgi:hypothetical protein
MTATFVFYEDRLTIAFLSDNDEDDKTRERLVEFFRHVEYVENKSNSYAPQLLIHRGKTAPA